MHPQPKGRMSKIPFTVYDFFAYLSSGALLVAAFDFAIGYQWLRQANLSIPIALLLTFSAYLTGHLIAHVSKVLLEEILVTKCLGRSAAILLAPKTETKRAKLFPGYHKPLPIDLQKRVADRAAQRGVTSTGEALFLHAYGVVTQSKDAQARLDEFRNLYGFCRNTALSLVAVTLVLTIGYFIHDLPPNPWLLAFPAVFSFGMLYRYLKFFRQFSYQLLVTYAELPVSAELKVNA